MWLWAVLLLQNTSHEIILTLSATRPKNNNQCRLSKHMALTAIQEVHDDQWSPKTTNITFTALNTDNTCYQQNMLLKSHTESVRGRTFSPTDAVLYLTSD